MLADRRCSTLGLTTKGTPSSPVSLFASLSLCLYMSPCDAQLRKEETSKGEPGF